MTAKKDLRLRNNQLTQNSLINSLNKVYDSLWEGKPELFIFKYRRWLVDMQNELGVDPDINIKVHHKWFGDCYTRTAVIPKGTFLIGATHAADMIDVVLKGEILLMIDGQHIKMKAGDRLTTHAGSKKAGYALTDVAYCNTYYTKHRDIEEVEAETLLTDEEEEHFISIELKHLEAICQQP